MIEVAHSTEISQLGTISSSLNVTRSSYKARTADQSAAVEEVGLIDTNENCLKISERTADKKAR